MGAVFVAAGVGRIVRERGRIGPASRTWLMVALIFALASLWLWSGEPAGNPDHSGEAFQGDSMPRGIVPGPVGRELLAMDEDTLAKTGAPAPGPVGLSAKGGTAKAGGPGLGNQVAGYARSRIGQTVGNGECFDLADHALHDTGAKSAADFGAVTPDAEYKWGDPVRLAQLRPGDIIQFRGYRYDRTVETTTATHIDTQTDFQQRPHHTAVVDRVNANGAITVIEQNVPPGAPVQRCQLFFADVDTTSGNHRTTITVQGSFWFYRPQPH